MKSERRQQVAQSKAQVWTDYIRAGIDAKQEWLAAVEEVESYLRPKHAGLFQSDEMQAYLPLGGDHQGMAVYVNKIGLIKAVLVAHLAPQNYKREVSSRSKDAVYIALAALLEAYLNYTQIEGKINPEKRAAIMEGVVYGIGFMRSGWDPEREIHTSHYVSALDVVIDPNARSLASARWIAVGTRMALDEVRTLYKAAGAEKWRLEGLDLGPPGDSDSRRPWENPEAGKLDRDQVTRWVVYSKMGNGLTRGPLAPEEFKNDEDSNLFVRLDLILGHPYILEEGEWDLPLYLDREWPIAAFIPSSSPGRLWPDSLFIQALIHQKSLDVLSTLELNAARIHGRDLFAYRSDVLDDNNRAQLLYGGMSVAVPLANLPPGASPSDVLYRIPIGTQANEISRVKQWHNDQLEALTGVTPALQGAAGGGAVERSATAVQQQSQGSYARLADLQAEVEAFCTQLTRAEAISVRLAGLVDAKDIEAAVGPDLQLGYRIDVEGAPMPLRGPASIETVAPLAATYFESEEQAAALLGEVWTGLLAAGREKPFRKLVADLVLDGGDGATLPKRLIVRKVTATDVFRDTAGLTPRDLMRELQYTIATGTTSKQDPAAKRAQADKLLQVGLPIAKELGDVEMVNELLERSDKAYNVPPDERFPEFKPPPPPLPPPGGPEVMGPPAGMGGEG